MERPLPERWWRTDLVVALVLAVAGVEFAYLLDFAGLGVFHHSVHWVAAGAVLMALPLVLRRRCPQTVAVGVSLLYILLTSWVGIEFYASQVVLFLAFYSIGAWSTDRRQALQIRIGILAVMFVWLAVATVDGFTTPDGEQGVNAFLGMWLIQLTVNIAYFGGAWFFGDRAWTQAVEQRELELAHEEIRAQQEQLAEQAVSLERMRIARELHDVVAHHVTAMGVQAGAARMLQAKDPEAAAAHLKGVEDSSRQAVRELQTMVHTLRDDDAALASVPRLADLEALVEEAASAGTASATGMQTVALERVGPAPELPPATELALYRVAQEGLTNARKHAGPRAQVTVRLRTEGDRVELEVSDDGRGGSGGEGLVPAGGRSRAPGTRMGLRGMRERMDSVGGTVEAGPKPTGGWLVRATVPAAASAESAASAEPAASARTAASAEPAATAITAEETR